MSQLNVDPQEIAKFEAFAAIWWDQHSEFRPLHMINPLRLNWIDEHAGGISGKKVLDVGCGGGLLSEALARAGATVTAIDLAPAVLDVARLSGSPPFLPDQKSRQKQGAANEQFDHGITSKQRYLISRYSSMPYLEPSRPMPDCLMPPNGATSFEIRPVLMPTMPYSSASPTRQQRPMSRLKK